MLARRHDRLAVSTPVLPSALSPLELEELREIVMIDESPQHQPMALDDDRRASLAT